LFGKKAASAFFAPVKGSLTRDFQHLFFSQISFHNGPVYPIGAISSFYENLQIYLKAKDNHQCQQHKL
jgi:hypothetical protein